MPAKTSHARPTTQHPLALGAALLILALPLLLYAISGTYARFAQDDYCYAVNMRANGVASSWLHAFVNATPFSGNRYSLTFFLDLSQSFGAGAVPVLPALMIALWLTGMIFMLRNLNAAFDWQLSPLVRAMLAVGIAAFTLSQAANLTQVLYWRPGMFPYLAPIVALTGLLAWMSACLRKQVGWPALLAMSALALIAGGFSETAAIFHVGVFGVMFLSAFVALRQHQPWAPSGFRLAWSGLLGSLLAALALILSPAARLRQEALFPEPPGLPQVLAISLESARFFSVHTLYRVTLPTLAVGGLALSLALFIYTQRPAEKPIALPALLMKFMLTFAAGFFLLVCVAAPIAYAQLTYPEARVLLMARLVAVLVTGLTGWWSGQALASWRDKARLSLLLPVLAFPVAAFYLFAMLAIPTQGRVEPAYPVLRAYLLAHPATIATVLLVGFTLGGGLAWWSWRRRSFALAGALLAAAFLLQPLHASSNALYELPDAQLRGRMWDLRDAQIRALAAQGQRQVQVQALDSWQGITELQANPTHWVNNCAADYYGVDSITAVEPILNPPVRRDP